MTFGGVEIFGRVDGNNDSKVAQLEIVSSIIQNAFVPLSVKTELENGTRKVFDCSKFTVGGKHLTTRLADVDDFGDYVPEKRD